MRSPQRPHVRDDVPGQQYAAPPGVCGLCPPSCLADAHLAAYCLGPSATLAHHPHPLQSCHPDQTVQGSHPLAPAECLSCQGALTPCHCSLVGGARPPHEYVLRRLPYLPRHTPAGLPTSHVTPRRPAKGRDRFDRNAPMGVEVRAFLGAALASPASRGLYAAMPAQKMLSVRLPRDEMHSRMFKVTVYEKFRLGFFRVPSYPWARLRSLI